jgi:3-methyladenine DNA glycosylase/8-oxoguanine DNA glycosylase
MNTEPAHMNAVSPKQKTASDDALYSALVARDARFDGRFFVGVTSTRVYCRPVCRVRAPMRKNREFYDHAAAAEKAGFRLCLRCRPEIAPGHSSMETTARLAQKAAELIEAGLGEECKVGMPRARANALHSLAVEHSSGRLDFEGVTELDSFLERLGSIPGIGPWTVQYLAMRTLSWPDAFLPTDLGVKKALSDLDERAIVALAQSWRPWRAYAVMHLWLSLSLRKHPHD